MDAGGEPAELAQPGLQLLERGVHELRRRRPGAGDLSRAIRRLSAALTNSCWAPSWRSRSSRRGSASPASTSDAREAAS